jgi:hypothetical protein
MTSGGKQPHLGGVGQRVIGTIVGHEHRILVFCSFERPRAEEWARPLPPLRDRRKTPAIRGC